MPHNSGSMYGGNYDEVTAAKLADVGLPERLLCKNCGTYKPISQYSKRQKSNLRYNIFRFHKKNAPGAGDNVIVCRACTPQVTNELLCIMCDHVKDLASFAKNHRSTPEQARCKECMYEQMMNDQPGLEEYSEGSDSEQSNPHDSDDDVESESGNTLPLTLDNLHITQGQRGVTSYADEERRRLHSSRMTITSGSRSHGDSTADDGFRNEAPIEDDLRSNASTLGGVIIGSESAIVGSKASTTVDESDDETVSAASRWEKMKKMGYRAGNVGESATPTFSEKGKGKAFTGYDVQGAPHQRYRAESVTSERSGFISYTSRDIFPKVKSSAFASAKLTGTRNLLPSRDDFPETRGYHLGYDDDDDDDEGEMFI